MGDMVDSNYLSIFKNKRVMITGHTGFKGSWLAFLLYEIGAEVLGYALPANGPNSHFSLLSLADKIEHMEEDVRDAGLLIKTMKEFQPEFVFHLAAQALVRPSYSDPVLTYETNVMGSVNLLEAVRNCDSVRSLVYITSDKCYENLEWVWGYRENDALGGHDPYSSSKAAAELVFSSYSHSFFESRENLGAASTRAGNVIGGGDWAVDRIIPDCIRSIQSGSPIMLRNPTATRPWQHVLEPISGYLLLASRLYSEPKKFTGAWNFGPPSEQVRTVKEVAESIVEIYGDGSVQCNKKTSHHHEAQLLQLNCDKAYQLLNWRPRWNVDKTLKATAEWYKYVNNGSNATKVTKLQLQDYFTDLL